MKVLIIREVANGWIVSNETGGAFQPPSNDCFVYQTIEQLQNALPALLAFALESQEKQVKGLY